MTLYGKKLDWGKEELLYIDESVTSSPASSQVHMAKEENKGFVLEDTKRVVIIHVTFLKVGEINTLKEQFDGDILLRSKWREPTLDSQRYQPSREINWDNYWDPKVFIENAVGDPKRTFAREIIYNDNGEAFVVERRRVRGTFMETLELWEFPFDVQDLSIMVMSDMPSLDVELVEDPEEIHKIYKQSFIDEQEWYLYKYIDAEKKEVAKDRADPTIRRSALSVRCRAARRPGYFIWNMFSVTCLICCLSFLTFAVPHNLPQNRLQLTFTLMLTAVAFKFVVNQSLPRISYLTYLDRYILATMISLALVCFWHGITPLVPHFDDKEKIMCCVFAGLYALYNLQFVIRLLMNPYKKRREMKHLEAKYVRMVKEQTSQTRVSDRGSVYEPTLIKALR